MTTLAAYAAFLTARWDEDELTVLHMDCQCGDREDTRPDCPERLLADIAAKRAILGAHLFWEQAEPRDERAIGAMNAMRHVVQDLATPFRDHPDHPVNADA